jgi:hypothetical protein
MFFGLRSVDLNAFPTWLLKLAAKFCSEDALAEWIANLCAQLGVDLNKA